MWQGLFVRYGDVMTSLREAEHVSRRLFMVGGAGAALTTVAGCSWFEPPPPVISYLDPSSIDSVNSGTNLAAFRRGLAEQGFVEGDNVTIEYRYANGDADRLSELAKEAIAANPAVLVVDTSAAAHVVQALTRTMPIVFCQVNDAVESGEVANPERPEANVTGIADVNDLSPKRLRLLNALVPPTAKIGYLSNPNRRSYERELHEIQDEAERLKRRLVVLRAGNDTELAGAYAKLSRFRRGRGCRRFYARPARAPRKARRFDCTTEHSSHLL